MNFVVIIGVGAFAAGFAANMPMVISHLPRLSTTTPKPSDTPEEVIRQFIEAAHRHDIPAVIALYHPRMSGWQFIVFVIVLAGIASFLLDRK